MITARQRKQIEDTIRDHHLAFCAETLGREAIPEDDYKRLRAAGKIRVDKTMTVDAATASHILGTLLSSTEPQAVEHLKPPSFWNMATTSPPTLSLAEQAAVQHARDKIGTAIRGLGNKIDAATGQIVIDASEKLRRKKLVAVREAVASGIEERKTVDEISRRIRDAVGDSKRNWLQIAQTEVHNAMEEGKVTALVNSLPSGSDPLVYKRPMPDACPFCVLLYLKNGVPRVFRLSDLAANGSNVGRKAKRPTLKGSNATEWQATVGVVHPWCQCVLYHLPEGFTFDSKGVLVYVGVKKSCVLVESLDRALLNHECTD